MGRFARSQDVEMSTGEARGVAIPNFSSTPEVKSNAVKPRARKPGERRAKGMKYFWIVLVSMIGLSAGWMLGQAWISPEQQAPTQVAAIEPSAHADDSIESNQSSEENAIPPASSDQAAQSVEHDLQQNQASDHQDRRPNKARRAVAVTRAPRARAQGGTVTMMLKPFKAINPLKLRKLRPW